MLSRRNLSNAATDFETSDHRSVVEARCIHIKPYVVSGYVFINRFHGDCYD